MGRGLGRQFARFAARTYVVHDEAGLLVRSKEKCAINLDILVGGSNAAWRQLKEKEEAITGDSVDGPECCDS